MGLNCVELLLGWLAIILAGTVAAFTYFGGFIEPDSVQRDLIGFGVILLSIALGVTADGVFDFLPGRLLLALATLVFAVIAVISFVLFLLPPAALAVGATLLAFVRPYARPPQTDV
jgi:hypothetical protein